MPSDEPLPQRLYGELSEPIMRTEGQARFRLLYTPDGPKLSPEDREAREAVLPCVVTDPVLAEGLEDLAPGTMLHLTGYLSLPGVNSPSLRLVVVTAEIAAQDNEPFTQADEAAAYGDYLAIRTLTPSGDREAWHLIAPDGTYAGAAKTPDQIPDAISWHEAADGSSEA